MHGLHAVLQGLIFSEENRQKTFKDPPPHLLAVHPYYTTRKRPCIYSIHTDERITYNSIVRDVTHTYTHIIMYIHTYIHTYIHIYTYI